MAIWAIADIHASKTDPVSGELSKPMDLFGPRWEDHVRRLEDAWRERVGHGDTVVVVGDIDWALHVEDAAETLERLHRLPGRKALVRGNHDYWWSSKTTGKLRRRLPEDIELIHNSSIQRDGFNICGAKGSPVPGSSEWTPEQEKLLNREVQRLRMSLETCDPGLPTVAAVHYPPFYPGSGESPFSEVLEEWEVRCCVYGHLHGPAAASGPRGSWRGVEYRLVAGDAVDFRPVLIARDGELAGDPDVRQAVGVRQ